MAALKDVLSPTVFHQRSDVALLDTGPSSFCVSISLPSANKTSDPGIMVMGA